MRKFKLAIDFMARPHLFIPTLRVAHFSEI